MGRLLSNHKVKSDQFGQKYTGLQTSYLVKQSFYFRSFSLMPYGYKLYTVAYHLIQNKCNLEMARLFCNICFRREGKIG